MLGSISSAAQVYASLAVIFDQNYAFPSAQECALQIGDCSVQLRTTSLALHRQLMRPLLSQHNPNGRTADCFVDLVDLGEEPLPDLPWMAQHTSLEQQTSEYAEGPFLFTRHGDVLLTAFDQDARRTIGLVHAPTRWPLRHYKQSIFITLYQHLRRRGFYLIHASAIAQAGRAVLIAGMSGVGKTTTMLSCVAAGYQFLGDDTTLIRRSSAGGVDVIALLSTLDVTDRTAAWFPQLGPFLSPLRSHTGKRQVILAEVFPHSVAAQGRVAAILAPEIGDRTHTTLAPANKAALLSDLLLYSVDLQDQALARQHLEFLAQALEQIPVYRLMLGSDRQEIPKTISEVLRTQQ